MDLQYDSDGQKRTLYSARHTFASYRIIYGGMNVYKLAVHMGTSVGMIEDHYGHIKPLESAREVMENGSGMKR